MNRNLLILAIAACGLIATNGVQAVPIPGQGTWELTLKARDLDQDGSIDAFFDTELNITWLRDASAIGRVDWDTARAWAGNFTLGGYDDWRLPLKCESWSCAWSSEMSHLSDVTLGNAFSAVPGNAYNSAEFEDLQFDNYWSGSVMQFRWHYEPWFFDFSDGVASFAGKQVPFFAMAVHPGDIGVPVSEPGSTAMVLVGLALLSRLSQGASGHATHQQASTIAAARAAPAVAVA